MHRSRLALNIKGETGRKSRGGAYGLPCFSLGASSANIEHVRSQSNGADGNRGTERMRNPRMSPARSAALSFKVRGGAAFWRVRCRELLDRLLGRYLLFGQLQQ